MKKSIKILLPILILGGIIAYIIYTATFNINDDSRDISKAIEDFSNRGISEKEYLSIKTLDQIDIDNRKLVYYTVNDNLYGGAILKKNIFGKLKIESIKYGTSILRDYKIKTNKNSYLVVMSKNPKDKISYVQVKLTCGDKEEIDLIEVPSDKEYYIIKYVLNNDECSYELDMLDSEKKIMSKNIYMN